MSVTCEQSSLASSSCAFCQVNVRPSRHALQCTLCGRRQHRVCHRGNKSGVTHDEYLDHIEGRVVFTWHCVNCPQPGRQISDTSTAVTWFPKIVTTDDQNATTEMDRTSLLKKSVESAQTETVELESIQSEMTDNESIVIDSSKDGTIELEQSIDTTIQLVQSEYGTSELEQSIFKTMQLAMQTYGDMAHTCNESVKIEHSNNEFVLQPSVKSENGTIILEQSSNGTILMDQMEVVGESFIMEPQDLTSKKSMSDLEQSEEEDNTLVFERDHEPLEDALNGSNISEAENTIDQDEMSTVLFPSDATTPLVYTKSIIDIVTPSFHNPQTPLQDDATIHLETTPVLNNHSYNSVSFNSISFNQSTPIAPSRPTRRRATSFLRRVSAITTVNVPSPDRKLAVSPTGLTPISSAITDVSQSPINYSLLYKEVTHKKRRLSNNDEHTVYKKRNIEHL